MSKSFKEILEKVKSLPKKTVSVAVAQDSEVLLAVKAAKEKGIADSVLFGDAEKGSDGLKADTLALQLCIQICKQYVFLPSFYPTG